MPTKTRKLQKKCSNPTNQTRSVKWSKGVEDAIKTKIIETFLEMLNTVKLYHWHTHSFAEHKASDEMYENLNAHIDTFVETLLGKNGSRFTLSGKKKIYLNYKNIDDFKKQFYSYREFLISMTDNLNANTDSDLLNIRDEILGDINQFLYLLTLQGGNSGR
jgi:DNA-binding ferritin-like protein